MRGVLVLGDIASEDWKRTPYPKSLCSLLLPFSESLLRSGDLPENLLHDVGESEHGDSKPAAKKSAHVTEDFAALRK
ncbi:hypothetical protein AVEN_155750-1 [Araneus ventricosus]|uniref:Uncharacterized protein n=1 Tax=Araneus ventricosus TaxID=182803 RepID=A0A4Y2HV04_ARAVE|nr:hypothetical protein AVEN_155750-1 [Araneus ventricosus]